MTCLTCQYDPDVAGLFHLLECPDVDPFDADERADELIAAGYTDELVAARLLAGPPRSSSAML